MTTDNVTRFPEQTPPTLQEWIVGPFEINRVVLDGRAIPKMTAHRHEDGRVTLVLDNRYGIDCPDEGHAFVMACFAANAMAIGAGFPCYTADQKFQPFAPQCSQLGGQATGEE